MKAINILLFFLFLTHVQAQKVKISYIGNMGVIVGNEQKSILIDALHEKYKSDYLYPNDKTIDQLIRNNYLEYGPILLHIATHHHKDHFSAKLSNHMLKNNYSCRFIGSTQLTNTMDASAQIITFPYESALVSYDIEADIEVSAFKVGHSGVRHQSVENTAYIINFEGIKILHVGDSDWESCITYLQMHNVKEMQIDIAILPFWMLYKKDDFEKINEFIDPNSIILTHISPLRKDLENLGSSNVDQTIYTFTKANESFQYNK